MHYLVDGYNLLFYLSEDIRNFEQKRYEVIELLETKLSHVKLNITVVFDGAHHFGEESGLHYKPSLQIAFSPKGQTADDYILEKIEYTPYPADFTIVTSDKALARQCREKGSHTKSISSFLNWISKKSEKTQKPLKEKFTETDEDFERLLKSFEKKWKQDFKDKK